MDSILTLVLLVARWVWVLVFRQSRPDVARTIQPWGWARRPFNKKKNIRGVYLKK
jgi:hypothetical protein